MAAVTEPDLSLTYGELCRLIDIRTRFEYARAKIIEAQAAYDALMAEVRQFADVVTDRLITTYPKADYSYEVRTAMIKPWFEVAYRDPGAHENWITQLPVSVTDGRAAVLAEAPTPPVRPLHLIDG